MAMKIVVPNRSLQLDELKETLKSSKDWPEQIKVHCILLYSYGLTTGIIAEIYNLEQAVVEEWLREKIDNELSMTDKPADCPEQIKGVSLKTTYANKSSLTESIEEILFCRYY